MPHAHEDAWSAIEYRCPLLGRSLVELMLRVPWEDLLQPDRNRVLQRRALADVLPPSIRDRTDKGDFTMGVIHRFRSIVDAQPRIRQARWLGELGIVDPPLFSATVDRALHGLVDNEANALFSALTFECWLEANEVSFVRGSNGTRSPASDPV